MKLKKGFTIAELLITLGIVGFLAAVSAPVLIQSVRVHRACATLAKFDNTFSTAIEAAMSDSGIDKITSINVVLAQMAKYMDMTSTSNIEYSYNGGGSNIISTKPLPDPMAIVNCYRKNCTAEDYPEYDVNNDGKITVADVMLVVNSPKITSYSLSSGIGSNALVMFNSNVSVKQRSNAIKNNNFGDMVAEILIDVDGNGEENEAGKDLFAFYLSQSGELIPAGSKLQKDLDLPGSAYIGDSNVECSLASDATIAENFACTGAYADNGWSPKGLMNLD